MISACPPKPRKPYVLAGEIIACEAGHEVAEAAADLPRMGDRARQNPPRPLTNFRPFQNPKGFVPALLRGIPALCGICRARFMKPVRRRNGELKGYRLFVKGEGWRGEPRRRRKKRRTH